MVQTQRHVRLNLPPFFGDKALTDDVMLWTTSTQPGSLMCRR